LASVYLLTRRIYGRRENEKPLIWVKTKETHFLKKKAGLEKLKEKLKEYGFSSFHNIFFKNI
jgi:hypothetical protein